jgi:hypothetical protein
MTRKYTITVPITVEVWEHDEIAAEGLLIDALWSINAERSDMHVDHFGMMETKGGESDDGTPGEEEESDPD